MTTIDQQQLNSAILTGASWVTSGVALLTTLTDDKLTAITAVIITLALSFINHFQTATPAATPEVVSKPTTGGTTPISGPAATPVTPAPAATTFDPGFKVLPTFQYLKSGMATTLAITTGDTTTTLTIDWMDGTPPEVVPLTVTPEGKVAHPIHTYNYVQGATPYTGHSFYPKFTVSNGTQSKVFNDVANDHRVDC